MENAIRPAQPNGNDLVSIEGLRTAAIVGIYEWEQRVAQQLELDLFMSWDTQPAASSGDLQAALDYAAVSATVLELVRSQPWGLLETLAETIARTLHEQYQVPALTLRIAKPGAVPTARTVAVTIQRTFSQSDE